MGDLIAWDILSEMRRGQVSRLVSSGYPSLALPIDKYVLCGKKKKEKKMSSLAKEPKTNQILHRTLSDQKAEECRAGKNSPKREEREKN